MSESSLDKDLRDKADGWIAEYKAIVRKCHQHELGKHDENMLRELEKQLRDAQCHEWQVTSLDGETRIFPRTYEPTEIVELRVKCAVWIGALCGFSVMLLRGGKIFDDDAMQKEDGMDWCVSRRGFCLDRDFESKMIIFGTVKLSAVRVDINDGLLEMIPKIRWSEFVRISAQLGDPGVVGRLLPLIGPTGHYGFFNLACLLVFDCSPSVRRAVLAELLGNVPDVSALGSEFSQTSQRGDMITLLFGAQSDTGDVVDTLVALQEAGILNLNYQSAADENSTILHDLVTQEFYDRGTFFCKALEILLSHGADKRLRTKNGHTAFDLLFLKMLSDKNERSDHNMQILNLLRL